MTEELRQSPSGGIAGNPAFPRKANGTVGAAVTLDYRRFAEQAVVLGANCSMTIQGLTPGKVQWFQAHVQQDATGGRTLTVVGARTPGLGAGLTLSSAPGSIDFVSFFWSGTFLYAQMAGLAFA